MAKGQRLLLVVELGIGGIQQVVVEKTLLEIVSDVVAGKERLLLTLVPVHAPDELMLRIGIGRPVKKLPVGLGG